MTTLTLERNPDGVLVATQSDDRGTNERWLHDAYEHTSTNVDGEVRTVRKVFAESRLILYAKKGQITDRQAAAGAKLFLQWRSSGMEPRVIARYAEPSYGMSGGELRQAASEQAMVIALRTVGPRLVGVLVHVIIIDGTASEWAASQGKRGIYAEVMGMTTLRLALDVLADHYRVPG
jgi:hypothetical protein